LEADQADLLASRVERHLRHVGIEPDPPVAQVTGGAVGGVTLMWRPLCALVPETTWLRPGGVAARITSVVKRFHDPSSRSNLTLMQPPARPTDAAGPHASAAFCAHPAGGSNARGRGLRDIR
jgi:hypothetical protein